MTAGFRQLSVKSERVDDGVTVVVTGDLDHDSAPALRLELDKSIEDGVRTIVLDLTGVTFIDSAGLQVFVAVDAALGQREGSLTVDGASPVVNRILEVTGLDRLFGS